MPVKRRSDKRRLDPETEMQAWSSVFGAGHDFFRDLPAIGVPIDDYGRPDRDVTEDAWRRLGSPFLAERPADLGEAWAQREFGEPTCR